MVLLKKHSLDSKHCPYYYRVVLEIPKSEEALAYQLMREALWMIQLVILNQRKQSRFVDFYLEKVNHCKMIFHIVSDRARDIHEFFLEKHHSWLENRLISLESNFELQHFFTDNNQKILENYQLNVLSSREDVKLDQMLSLLPVENLDTMIQRLLSQVDLNSIKKDYSCLVELVQHYQNNTWHLCLPEDFRIQEFLNLMQSSSNVLYIQLMNLLLLKAHQILFGSKKIKTNICKKEQASVLHIGLFDLIQDYESLFESLIDRMNRDWSSEVENEFRTVEGEDCLIQIKKDFYAMYKELKDEIEKFSTELKNNPQSRNCYQQRHLINLLLHFHTLLEIGRNSISFKRTIKRIISHT